MKFVCWIGTVIFLIPLMYVAAQKEKQQEVDEWYI